LHKIKGLIKFYKNEREKYLELSEELIDPVVKKDYESWENLLYFLPSSVFYG